ncbi:FAD-dependent oxidoreductase, partial [Planctomicrobium sp.]
AYEEEVQLEFATDVQFDASEVIVPKLMVAAKHIIFCQGFQTAIPKQFEKVKFNPSKGEILTVAIKDFLEERILHKGFWVAHQNVNEYRVGATYDWNELSTNITEKSRNWITKRLEELVINPFEVLSQQAAVRPTMSDFQPVVGMHPKTNKIGMLNGLGSKGSLTAPRLASMLTQNILLGTSIPKEISLSRWFN